MNNESVALILFHTPLQWMGTDKPGKAVTHILLSANFFSKFTTL